MIKQTTNKTLVVALLFFLAAFYVASVSGYHSFRQDFHLACAPGDVNRDGAIATDRDFERLMRVMDGDYAANECADVNRDNIINKKDVDELYRLNLEISNLKHVGL